MAREMKDSGIEWIGEIPKEWEIIKLKKMMTFLNGYAFEGSRLSFEGKYPVIRIGDISNNKIDTKNSNKINLTTDEEEFLEKFLIKKNDILIAMSGATVGKLAFIDNIKEKAYINQRVGILRSNMNKYLFYSLSNNMFLKYIYLLSVGSAQPNISSIGIENYIIAIPTLEEQEKIVNYLDKKITDIDLIIEKTKATIEDYKKYKQSLITEVVTKGLDPNVEARETDNIHIKFIPKLWEFKKIKYLFTIKKEIAGKKGFDVLSITQKGIKIKDITTNEGQMAMDYSKYQFLNKGDFAMNHMDLLTGWVDISKYDGVTSPDYRVFILNDELNNSKAYYLYLMQMCYSNKIFYGLGQGVSNLGRWRLQADKFLNFSVPVPPLKEQQQIADYLDKKVSEIDNLISKKESLISEMEEYKKSLIYECVTGKKEVI